MVEESTAAVHALANEADAMAELMAQFELGGMEKDPLRAELKRAVPHAFAGEQRRLRTATPNASRPKPTATRKGVINSRSDGWEEF
jgi:methyl-accepting chemotaxis protein